MGSYSRSAKPGTSLPEEHAHISPFKESLSTPVVASEALIA